MAALVGACGGASATSSAPAASPSTAATLAVAATATAAPNAAPASLAPSSGPRPSLAIDPAELQAHLTSSITLYDLADAGLAVVATYLDPDTQDPFPLGTYALDSMDQMTNSVPPGTYRLEFRQPSSSATGPSCTIEITDADAYVFAVVRDAVAISRLGTTPTSVREVFIATSSLCRR